MIVTTSETIAGYRIVETHGLVRGNTLRARHVGRDIAAVLRSLVGGEISDYTKMMGEAREQSLDRMIEEVRGLGGNAIVAVRFSTSYIMANVAEILAFGTAVTVEPED
ncbi:MAG: YbjQ family protein [Acidobacteriota bacterium]